MVELLNETSWYVWHEMKEIESIDQKSILPPTTMKRTLIQVALQLELD